MSPDPLDRVKAFFGDEEPSGGRPRIGRYEIVREIARGGMSVVYEAHDPELGRRVALKVPREDDRDRMLREAAAAARLRNPNIVAIHEVGKDFIAMEFVEGRTLAEAAPAMDLRERVRVLETVARAAAFAHAEGVIHRDLKPANVLLEKGGRVVLTDFGLAKIEGAEELTRTGALAGTPHYMAPEQARGDLRQAGPAADVWALGVMLFEALSGRKPFEGATALAVYDAILREDAPILAGDLGAVAAKALEKDPARRYAEARVLAQDLARWLAGEPVGVRPPGPAGRAWRRIRKNPAAWALGAGAVAAFVAALGLASAGKAARVRGLQEQARLSLEAALELRRAGSNAGMRKFLPPLEEAYRRALGEAPDLAEPEYLMGRMHRALLEESKALEYQGRALAKDPEFAPALYERLVLLSMLHGREPSEETQTGPEPGWLAAHAATYLRVVGRGATLEAGVARGLLAFHSGDSAGARAALEETLRRDPLHEEARDALAQVVRAELRPGLEEQERKWKQAEELYAQGLAKDRGYVPHWLGRGQLRWSRGSRRRHRGQDPLPDYGAAAEDFSEAIRLAGSAEAWSWRGQMRLYRAIYRIETEQDPRPELDAAEKDLGKAIELDPSYMRGWLWRGNTRFYRAVWMPDAGSKDFEAAEKDLSEAVRLTPSSETHRWRGRMRAQHARSDRTLLASAAEDFERALPDGRQDAWYWTWRSTVPTVRGLAAADPLPDFAEAEENLDEAIRLSRHHMEAWKHRGFVRWHRAEGLAPRDRRAAREAYLAAAADFQEALTINPTLRYQIGDRLERARKKAAELGD